MRGKEMRAFWDRRARENPLYYVDNRLSYGDPDDETFWAGGEDDLDLLLGAVGLDLAATDRVVEIGCGVGRLTRVIAHRAASVAAFDVSTVMLELARQHNPRLKNVDWLLGDGESLAPLRPTAFDACISHVVFQHIPDPAVTLNYVRETGRVLVPGGWAAFQVSNLPPVHRVSGSSERLTDWLRGLVGRGPRGQNHPAWRGSAVDLANLRDAADSSGMDVDRVVGEGTQFCIVRLSRR